jgi:hypothetical protein
MVAQRVYTVQSGSEGGVQRFGGIFKIPAPGKTRQQMTCVFIHTLPPPGISLNSLLHIFLRWEEALTPETSLHAPAFGIFSDHWTRNSRVKQVQPQILSTPTPPLRRSTLSPSLPSVCGNTASQVIRCSVACGGGEKDQLQMPRCHCAPLLHVLVQVSIRLFPFSLSSRFVNAPFHFPEEMCTFMPSV